MKELILKPYKKKFHFIIFKELITKISVGKNSFYNWKKCYVRETQYKINECKDNDLIQIDLT
jgi:hypothetical protein